MNVFTTRTCQKYILRVTHNVEGVCYYGPFESDICALVWAEEELLTYGASLVTIDVIATVCPI